MKGLLELINLKPSDALKALRVFLPCKEGNIVKKEKLLL